MNIKIGILNEPKHCNKHDLIHFVTIISSFYIQNFKTLASFCSWADLFVSYLVENPEDRFSCDKAHLG